ncbi:MAG: hypothetical protein KC416_01510 [Myxococcales bacterium]|nr:hypothetical protein [Myxococcales bacterium]
MDTWETVAWTRALPLLLIALGCGTEERQPRTELPSEPRQYEVETLPPLAVGEDRKGSCKDDSTDCYYPDPATTSSPNLDCVGTRTWPETGALVKHSFRLEDFLTYEPVAGACVNFYLDNQVPPKDTCDGSHTTDKDGLLTVEAPENAVIAYRVFPLEGSNAADTFVDTIETDFLLRAVESTSVGTAISLGALNLIPTILQLRRKTGTALLAATVRDCDGDLLFGARTLVYTTDGRFVGEGETVSDPHLRYFNGAGLPSADQPWIHVDGVFAVMNLPPTEEEYVVEIWGRRKAGEAPERISCERFPVFPDSLSLMQLRPSRAGGPACVGTAPEGW